jgi:hypothetical protein
MSTPNIAFMVKPHLVMQTNIIIGPRLLEKPKQPIQIDLYGQYLRVEHGTPRRHFARLVLDAFKKRKLTRTWMNRHCDKRWKAAVITHAEDKRLSEGGRSTLLKTPDARWAAANIKF